MCSPLNVGCSWRGIAKKENILGFRSSTRRPLKPICAFCRHQFVRYTKAWTWAISCNVRHSNVIHVRSAAGDVLWLSCDNVLMRHPSYVSWLLTAECQSANWRFLKNVFWRPTNILNFYTGSKVRAAASQVLKVCRWSRGIAPPTLQLSVRWRWVFSLRLVLFCTRWYRTGGWLDRQTGRAFRRREKFLAPAEDRIPELYKPKNIL
jgi:hypothetical protein